MSQLEFIVEQVQNIDRAADVIAHMAKFVAGTMKTDGYAEAEVHTADLDLSLILKFWTENSVVVITASEQGAIVGMQVWMSHPAIWRPKKVIVSTVLNYLDPTHRGTGAAREMLDFAKAHLAQTVPKGTIMLLEILHSNPHAQAFEGLGFKPFLTRYQGFV
jgi:ribosomal protein S18 acetylase RimI-like enzyme